MADEKDEKKVEVPKPLKELKIIQQMYNQSVEEPYFWIINWFKDDNREKLLVPASEKPYDYFNESVDKINDVFASSESSSYFGSQASRLGIQQDKVAGYLASVGKMIKDIFQLVREMRVLRERLDFYEQSHDDDKDKALTAEITLKGMYIDLVEGGAKNPASVYGLASTVGFVILPDLFFRVMVKEGENVGEVIERDYGKFNEKVKEVLRRKLSQYYVWKKRTHEEVAIRRKFMLGYLRQHYKVIEMYMAWIRPYLRHIERLSPHGDYASNAELISGMEQAILEIEILVKLKKSGKYIPCSHLNFFYRTSPQMSYQTQDYQKGPAHVGRLEMTFRAMVMTEEEIKQLKADRVKKDFEALSQIDDSVRAALDGMGEELKKYLDEADEEANKAKIEKEKKDKEKKDKEERKKAPMREKLYRSLFGEHAEAEKKSTGGGMIGPFVEVFRGFAQLADATTGVSKLMKPPEKGGVSTWQDKKDKKKAESSALLMTCLTYHIFKKSHGMITW